MAGSPGGGSKRLQAEVASWLTSKGARDIALSGTFAPEDGSKGTYTIQSAADGPRTWWMVQLQEDNAEGRRFSTAVSITNGSDRVSVYVTLETGWINARIMPVPVDPKCPRIVRSLLRLPGRWYHGGSPLRRGDPVSGFDDGESLALEIQNPNRTIPIVVISTDSEGPALPELHVKLAHDLAGLADVVVVEWLADAWMPFVVSEVIYRPIGIEAVGQLFADESKAPRKIRILQANTDARYWRQQGEIKLGFSLTQNSNLILSMLNESPVFLQGADNASVFRLSSFVLTRDELVEVITFDVQLEHA